MWIILVKLKVYRYFILFVVWNIKLFKFYKINLVLFILNLDIMYEINVYVNIFLVFVICMWLFIKRGNLKFFYRMF